MVPKIYLSFERKISLHAHTQTIQFSSANCVPQTFSFSYVRIVELRVDAGHAIARNQSRCDNRSADACLPSKENGRKGSEMYSSVSPRRKETPRELD